LSIPVLALDLIFNLARAETGLSIRPAQKELCRLIYIEKPRLTYNKYPGINIPGLNY
jgi:hypothetical protein